MEDSKEAGHGMKAVDVFAAVLKYFEADLLKRNECRNFDKDLKSSDIHWVITVPAILDLKAKQFMKHVAAKVMFRVCVKCGARSV